MENTEAWDVDLMAAGRPIPGAAALIRRYLGLGPLTEVWGAAYYDIPPTSRSSLAASDLLASAALGVRVTRESLSSFEAARPLLDGCLARLPTSLSLADADDTIVELISHAVLGSDLEPTVAAKLLHRLRPRLVPPYDRATSEWYSSGFGHRDEGRPPNLLMRMRDDLALNANRASLSQIQASIAIESDGALVPSQLRLLDIAIWMASRNR